MSHGSGDCSHHYHSKRSNETSTSVNQMIFVLTGVAARLIYSASACTALVLWTVTNGVGTVRVVVTFGATLVVILMVVLDFPIVLVVVIVVRVRLVVLVGREELVRGVVVRGGLSVDVIVLVDIEVELGRVVVVVLAEVMVIVVAGITVLIVVVIVVTVGRLDDRMVRVVLGLELPIVVVSVANVGPLLLLLVVGCMAFDKAVLIAPCAEDASAGKTVLNTAGAEVDADIATELAMLFAEDW